MSRRSVRPRVLLPQPLSPTSPSVSPRTTSKLTPSTAFTVPRTRPSSPPRTGKCVLRSRRPGAGARSWRGHRVVAGGGLAVALRLERRIHPGAHLEGALAAVPEAAARRAGGAGSAPCRGWSSAAGALPRVCTAWKDGMERSRPAVYGCAGWRNSVRTGACSTTRPAYITTTASQLSATTPRSWVMSMTAMPALGLQPLSSSRICAWIVTSSAVVGSSAMSSSGLHASAMAIITRWRMPPRELVRVRVHALLGRGDAHLAQHLHRALPRLLPIEALVQPDRLADLLAHRVDGVERRHRLLEDHRDLVAADAAHLRLGERQQVPPLEADLARSPPGPAGPAPAA